MLKNCRFPIISTATVLLLSLTACQSTPSNNASSSSSSDNSSTSNATAPPGSSGTDSLETSTSNSANSDGSPSGGGLTNEEVIDGLDAELDESIAVFDGMILDERAKAEAIVAESYDPAGGDSGDPSEVLFEEGDLKEGLPGYGDFPEGKSESGNDTDNTEGGKTERGKSKSSDDGSAGSSSTAGGIPEDISDGSDDDIVARQIREAAQKEKDPVLKEKLWDEYRKYKNQQRGG